MNETRPRVVRLAASAVAVALALLWGLWAAPRLTRLPEDFRYDADIFSRDDFYDEKKARFTGEVLSLTTFHYAVVEQRGDLLTVKNVFDVRKTTGEQIFAVERLYGVDRHTGRHAAGAGDKDRDGYLFAPRGADKSPFIYWHINYDAPARLTFQDEEEILGLKVHRYSCDYQADQTASLSHLPGVPTTRGVELDIHLELWVEPDSGWMVKYEDHATAHYYDIKTRERLHPWNRFRNRYTDTSVADQVRLARRARVQALWAGPRGLTAWLLLAAGVVLWALGPRRPAAAAFLAALSSGHGSLRRRVALASAACTALLGLAVICGWVVNVPRVVQVRPAYAAMQFNTALGFLLCGIGLWGHLASRRHLARGMAFAAGALGLVTFSQYLFGVDLRVDQLFRRATITTHAPYPGRMAPMTAICFALSGVALFVAARDRRTAAAGVAGSLVTGLGGAALLGYALGLPETYRLGPWTSMAVHTAAGFVVLGAGCLAAAWPDWESAAGPRWVGVFCGVGGLSFLLILYYALDSREHQNVQRLFALEADQAAGRVADRISERILGLRRMAGRWTSSGGTPKTAWEADAARYVEDHPGFQAVSWTDPSARVRWIVPLAGNEAAVGLDLVFEENRRRALEEARRTREVTFSRPVDLAQGGRGFLVCIPLYLEDGRFDGFLTGVFRFDRLIDVLVHEIASQGHAVSVRDGDELLYRRGPAAAARKEWTVEREVRFAPGRGGSSVTLPNARVLAWRVTLTARPEWAHWVRSFLPEVTLATGIAVLVLVSLCLTLAWQAARRAVLLQREIEAGRQREAQFRDFLEGAPDAVVIADAEGRIVLVNAQTEELLGYGRTELENQPLELLLPDRFRATDPAHRQGHFAAPPKRQPKGVGAELFARRRDGTELPVEVSTSPLKTEEGVWAMSAIRDVSRQREAQRTLAHQAEDLRSQRAAALTLARDAQEARQAAEAAERRIADSLREKEILLQEVHHRVKNNLQVISSLVNMQVRKLPRGQSREALEECRSRVQAIALIHEKLYQSKDFARVPFSDYARSLVANVFHATGVSPESVSLQVAIDELALPVDKAIPCGLILNELITNALKHAFRDGRVGTIRVELDKLDGGRLRLVVRDDGIGLPPGLDVRTSGSLGLQLVRMLTEQIGGDLEVRTDGGTSFGVKVPVEG